MLGAHKEVVSALDIHRLATGMNNSRWNSSEGESIAQNLVAVTSAYAMESHEDSATARVQSDTILVAGVFGKGSLASGNHAGILAVGVVAVQAPRPHELVGELDSFIRNWVRSLDVLGQSGEANLGSPLGGCHHFQGAMARLTRCRLQRWKRLAVDHGSQ